MLLLKLLRDLRRQGWLTWVSMLVTALGVALFVSSAASFRNLEQSYRETQKSLALADLHIAMKDAGPGGLTIAKAAHGVADATLRQVSDVPMIVDKARRDGAPPGPLKVTGRLISLPPTGMPRLDRLLVVSGGLPGRGQLLVEQHFARYHQLGVGARVRLDLPGERGRDLRISGVAVSPEYLWVSRDTQDPMPTPLEFGVFWIDRADLGAISGRFEARAIWLPLGVALFAKDLVGGADPSHGNQLLVQAEPGADLQRVRRDLVAALGTDQVLSATTRSDLPSIRLLQLDLDGFRGMAWFFPLLFLGVAGFMTLASMGRVVDSQRTVIGTFLALGMPRGRLIGHFLGLSVLPAVAGSVAGAALGVLASGELTREYAAEFGIPSVTVHSHPDLVLAGIALGVATALLAAWVPARRVAALSAAEAMRPPVPAAGRIRGAGKPAGDRAPSHLALAIRNVVRRPVRSLLSAGGVAAALLLVLVTGVVFDAMEAAMSLQFDRAQRHDLRVDFYLPWDQVELGNAARAIAPLKDFEMALALPVDLEAAGKHHLTYLEAAPAGAKLLRTLDFAGNPVQARPGEVILAREVARKLSLTVGQTVVVRRLPDGLRVPLRVGGLSDTAMGGGATMPLQDAWRAFGNASRVNSLRVTCDPADRWAVRTALERLPRVAAIQDRLAFRALVTQMMGFGYAMIGTMLLFSAVLAAAILFNTVTLSILERTRELATLRALGMSAGECGKLLAVEFALIAALGLAIGLPAGLLAGHSVLGLYRSDLFSLPFAVTGRTLAFSVFGVLLVLGLALGPGLRRVSRLDLAAAIRERTG